MSTPLRRHERSYTAVPAIPDVSRHLACALGTGVSHADVIASAERVQMVWRQCLATSQFSMWVRK